MFVLVLVVSACGDGDEAADTSTTTTEAPTTTEAASGNVVVTLSEFVIDTEDTLTAGEVTFDVVNDAGSEFNHEFAIIAADSYDELPKLDNGAVDEQALAEGQFLGRTAVLEPGQSETITFDLEPGTYLFICNINFGPNSHAANGQMLIATVNP
jgi:uncharacterized cupredoxin-like copper-binding protein